MKRFYLTVSLFGLMFLGYPEVAAVVGKHVGLLLNQLIGLYTCYSLVDTFHGVADFLYSCLEKINLTYLGALFVAEIGSMVLCAVYRLFVLLKLKSRRVSYRPEKLKFKFPGKTKSTNLNFQ